METMKAIKTRSSVREYQDKQITDEQLKTLLIAANAAPIAMANFESMHFTVIQASGFLQRINESMLRQIDAPEGYVPTAGAPTLILVSSKDPDFAENNTSCVIQNILLAATDMGLGSLYLDTIVMAMRDDHGIMDELDLPIGFRPIAAAAVGYPKTELIEREINLNKISTSYIK